MKKVFALLLPMVLFAGCTSNPGQSISSADGEILSAAESTSQTQTEESQLIPDETSSLDIIAALFIDDFFTITGRGCAVTGDVNAGKFSVGDTIAILHNDKQIAQTTILNILIGSKEAEIVRMEDDDISVLLEGIDRSLLTRGDRVVKYGSSQASSSQNDSGEKTVYSAEELQAFFVQVEEYARTGDIRLLDHLNFKDERNYAGMKAVLEDETARELWCAAFAPTVWRFPEVTRDVDFSRAERLTTYIKTPMWMYVNTLHTALSSCAPLSNTPDTLKFYFAEYADVIPYWYSTIAIQYTDGTLKLNGENFAKWYVNGGGGDDILSKAVRNPIESFTDFIRMNEYTTDLPELTEEEKLLTDYYKLVADNRFFDAIELMKGTGLAVKGTSTLKELDALTDEQKAKLQVELDKLPKGEFYQYSMVGAKEKLVVRGVLISYGLEYDKNYDIFGEGLPIPVKEFTHCYQSTDKPSVEHFPAIYNIMRNMEP